MKLFVTGATGFVGSHFVHAALEAGHEVTALRRSSSSQPRLPLLVAPRWLEKGLDAVTADDLAGHDVLVHLAAAGVKSSRRTWPEGLETNVVGTARLFDTACRCPGRVPSFVMARTFYEDLVSQDPGLNENPYIATKWAASEVIRVRAGEYAAPIAFVRVFQVYGPLDDPRNVLSYAAGQFSRGEKACFGTGHSRRDWIRVSDAARGLLAAVEKVSSLRASEIHNFDLGSGQLHSIREMVERLARIAGLDPEVACEFDPKRDRPDVGVEMAASPSLGGGVDPAGPDVGLSEMWSAHLEQLAKS